MITLCIVYDNVVINVWLLGFYIFVWLKMNGVEYNKKELI